MSVTVFFDWEKSVLPQTLKDKEMTVHGATFPIYQDRLSFSDVMLRLLPSLTDLDVVDTSENAVSFYCDLYVQTPKFQNCIYLASNTKKIINTSILDDYLNLKLEIQVRKGETKPHFYSIYEDVNIKKKYMEWAALFLLNR